MSEEIPGSTDGIDERELFLIGNQGYSNIRTAKLEITPDDVKITPAKTAWGCLVSFNLLCLLVWFGFFYPVYLYAEEDRRVFGLFAVTLTMLATAAGVTALTLWQFWREQARGDWLIIDRWNGVVSLPRQGITVPIEAVDHLQAITGTRYQESGWSESEHKSELNIVIRAGGELRRFNLITYLGDSEFEAMAKSIATLELLPVKRVKSIWEPKQIFETWLTPQQGFKSQVKRWPDVKR
ncbi:hypothetical protein LOC68_05815 [Blastopirellula sp. JC732]|uniref:Uncharacterized protein n=1 Tax=Blastopirellula sediminis TaxID=2894196 RepID=A0A9X1MLW3_9BACT|nr:hypothetical protein [Blastopirellula sediminis]MCC9609319.1 hypothetical protein [Blastopirellula sediminis]MCC9627904.1 hypothetical protein [Blastopirellula sediminis]